MRMPNSRVVYYSCYVLILSLAFFAVAAYAEPQGIHNGDLTTNVYDRFSGVAKKWRSHITAAATWVFWVLATISMVWTFGLMALRKADIAEFFAEFIRFTMFTGFYWWLLLNGPSFAVDIMTSLRTIGADAAHLPNNLDSSGIVDVGFSIFDEVVDKSSVWKPMDSLFGLLLSLAILIIFALVGVNMLMLLISGYIFAYAGVFILGFGGSRWTSDMAIGYFKSILNIALQMLTMVLLVGIGKSFVDEYYYAMTDGVSFKELAVMVVVAVILLSLVSKLPPQIGALAGGTTGNLGSNFGAGAAVAAAAMVGAAISTAGAAVAAGAANIAGGAQALMAAFSNANASEGGRGSGMMDVLGSGGGASDGGSGASCDGNSFAAAMGDSSDSTGSGTDTSSAFSSASGEGSLAADGGSSAAGNSAGNADGASSGDGSRDAGSKRARAGGMAAKASRIAAGTAKNLAQGSWDVTKAKAASIKKSTMDRVGETTGGKIAAAINARGVGSSDGGQDASFSDNSLSAGSTEVDADAEIASFRDRD